jgi:ribonuclease BN (tRNA processing enzyme)
VTIVPAEVTARGRPARQFLTSYLLNDSVALDAGCLGLYRSPRRQARVNHVLLSHSHLDHLASLPFFLDNVHDARHGPVQVHAGEAVLDCLRRDLFNDRLWPDFIRLSADRRPFLTLNVLEPGKAVELDGLRVTPVPVNHAVPTLGFVVEDGSAAVAFPSDTGPTEEIWRRAGDTPNLKAVFLEATFPDGMGWLADLARHLTPALFAREAAKLGRDVTWIAVHVHPRFRKQVMRELRALGMPNLRAARFGRPYHF